MFKLGLIGCGRIAQSSHIPAIHQTDGLTLHAVYDPDRARLERMQQEFAIPNIYSDFDAFFRSGIDAVVIASPAPAHRDNVILAANYGIPILCEKPFAMNRTEGEEMLAATQAAGVPVYTAFCYRFSPVALKIRELVEQKAIGEVRSLRLIYNWNVHGKYEIGPDGTLQIQERRRGRMLEGGPMIDCGTHQIDLSRFWLNSDIIQFSAHGAWVEDYEAPDHMWLHLNHANGAHTMVEISYSYHQVSPKPRREFVYELIGTDGVIRFDRENRSFTLDDQNGTQVFPHASEKNFHGMYQEFVSALKTGSSSLLASAQVGIEISDIAMRATQEAMRERASLMLDTIATAPAR